MSPLKPFVGVAAAAAVAALSYKSHLHLHPQAAEHDDTKVSQQQVTSELQVQVKAKNPSLAPQFDGIHAFETIIPAQ